MDNTRRLSRVESKLDQLSKLLLQLIKMERRMFEDLKAQIERNHAVDESAIVLLNGLKAKLDQLAGQPTVDPAEVQALADSLGASTDELAAAVTANTPADPSA